MKTIKQYVVIIAIVLVLLALGALLLTSKDESYLVELSGPSDVAGIASSIPEVDLVLLGESTHGTHEYYLMRTEISKKLIQEKPVSFIAVEGDWEALYKFNNYVLGYESDYSSALEIAQSLDRWPRWMWGNEEVVDLIDWLKGHNESLNPDEKVRFYGMDVYDQWRSLDRLLEISKVHMDSVYEELKSKSDCFSKFRPDEWSYAQALVNGEAESCEGNFQSLLELVKANPIEDKKINFQALQSAYVLKNAEAFYRLSATEPRGPGGWNARATHMAHTVDRLLAKHRGVGIVWAHNTHVGDARATDMAQMGQVNIGELSRSNYGEENVFILGFSTFTGQVKAGYQWGAEGVIMGIPEAMEGSIERVLLGYGHDQFFIRFGDSDRRKGPFSERVGHRAIGVVYNPFQESGNYVPTTLARRYDGLVFFRETSEIRSVSSQQ